MELNLSIEDERILAIKLYNKHKVYISKLYPMVDTQKEKNKRYQDSLKTDPIKYALVREKRRQYYLYKKSFQKKTIE